MPARHPRREQRTAPIVSSVSALAWSFPPSLFCLLSNQVPRSPLEFHSYDLTVPQRLAVLLGPSLELVFLDLLARGLGQYLDKMDEPRHHEMRHVAVGKAHQFLFADLATLAAHHEYHHLVLAEFGRDRHRGDFQHRRMFGDQHLDLIGRDVLATAANGFLLTIDEIEIAVAVHPAAIAGVQPEVAGVAHRRLRHLVVAGHHDAALNGADADFADFAHRQRMVLIADDLQFSEAARLAGGSSLVFGIVRSEHGHSEGLGHRIDRGHLNAKTLGYFPIRFTR